MKDKKYPDWQICFLAAVVIFQSVVLVSMISPKVGVAKKITVAPLASEQVNKETAKTELYFLPSAISIKKGETRKVDLFLRTKEKLNISGMDIVLVFDPKIVEVVQSEAMKVMPTIIEGKESEVKGKLSWTYLNEKREGVWFSGATKILTLTLSGKAVGQGQVSILSAEEFASTVLVEDVTAEKIPFVGRGLTVTVR